MVEKIMHVRIPDQNSVKRAVLESAIDIIQIHKSLDKLKFEKKQNELYAIHFKKVLSEIIKDCNSVKLPKVEKEKQNIIKKIKKHPSKKTKKKTIKKKTVYGSKFEKDINKLQSKIQNL